ncbi:hypothetical protein [Janibacter indicus]|uniref:hypothetical protein n=1 Tax=Janibacter indicus TaxID=857417 RepID=UPI000ADFC4F9|nr:hypothetical protein [Janibacter indicus]
MTPLRPLVGFIAVLLVIAGVTVTVLLGPDDTWGGEPEAVPDAKPVIVSGPQLLDVAGLSLVVTARPAGEGAAFVGAGHPVHVQDYVRDVARTEITALSASGVGDSQALSGERQRPAVAPGELDVWQEQASGDPAKIEIPLTEDEPVQIAAAPATGAGAAPELGIGYALPGAFIGGLVAVLIGVLLLVGTIVLGRRAKGAQRAVSESGPQPSAAQAGSARASSGIALRLVATVSAVALAAGCSIPQRVDHGTEPGVVPLEEADAQTMLDDYDRRNNAAIKKSDAGDGSLWATADAGPNLAVDALVARTAKFYPPKKDDDGDFIHEVRDVYEVEQPGYPLWSLIDVDLPNSDLGGGQYLRLYTRDGATEPWKGYTSVYLPSRLVTPLDAQAATPSAKDLLTAAQWDDELTRWIAAGKESDLRISRDLMESYGDMAATPKGVARIDHSVSPWGGRADGRTEQDGPVRVLRVKQGLLVITNKQWERNLYLEQGFEWKQATRERKIHSPHHRDLVYDEHYLLSAAILIPDSGAPSVIGSDVERVLEFPR